jgi:hypothetical protein
MMMPRVGLATRPGVCSNPSLVHLNINDAVKRTDRRTNV